jgi:hypothetical protein
MGALLSDKGRGSWENKGSSVRKLVLLLQVVVFLMTFPVEINLSEDKSLKHIDATCLQAKGLDRQFLCSKPLLIRILLQF